MFGVPAVTATTGSAFPEKLAGAFAGRPVAVCFDAGEEALAARAMEKLNAAGATAWVVPLPLPDKDDLGDWFRSTAGPGPSCIG